MTFERNNGKRKTVEELSNCNNIEWKDGAVCYANGEQWFASDIALDTKIFDCNDFQLNEPKQGDYLPKSELDTEQKYNDAVEVFGLFGFEFNDIATRKYSVFKGSESLTYCSDGLWQTSGDRWNKRKLTYNQLMAIGKLKRLMSERKDEESAIQDAFVESWLDLYLNTFSDGCFHNGRVTYLDENKPGAVSVSLPGADADLAAISLTEFSNQISGRDKKRNKSKQAYEILKSLDYGYDLVKQCWYRKEYIK